jgi:glycerol-3-phosphate cytidylyltransferase-like family protein
MSFASSPDGVNNSHKKMSKYAHTEKEFDHVMTFGTFDIFHPGHRFYLSEAQKFARKMTVVIARDARVLKIK